MNKIIYLEKNLVFIIFISLVSYGQGLIIDHNCTALNNIPVGWINTAKANLHIAYQHTSHGSQLISGMTELQNWKGEQYTFNNGGTNGALDMHDNAMSNYGASDLGNPDRTSWAQATSDFLNDPNNNKVNVIIWSWCGQVSTDDSTLIQLYLDLMNSLENTFPNVKFVYMTGHLDGTGVNGSLNQRNEQIRRYCRNNNKILYDFADIESYDPDGNFYLDKMANDNCDYNSDNNGTRKAYAAWWLWALLAGWEGVVANAQNDREVLEKSFSPSQNYPNPFNPATNFRFRISDFGFVSLKVYDILGNEIATLVNEYKQPGEYHIKFNADTYNLTSGVYLYQLKAGKFISNKKFALIK